MEAEERLVRQARQGERAAFEELVRRTTRLVYARVYLECGDAHQAEDLVQETFMRAFRSMGQVEEPAGFRAWLLRIAQTAAIDAYRHGARLRRAAPRRESQGVLGDLAAPAPEDPVRADQRETVRQVLNSLPEEYRLPLTLRHIDGADCASIQMQLGLSAGSLRGLLYRGLQLLRKSVKFEVPHESR